MMDETFVWHKQAAKDYDLWQRQYPGVARRINDLLADILENPFIGLGRPEPLKWNLRGWWSREIAGKHRLIYRVSGNPQRVEILSCKGHYFD